MREKEIAYYITLFKIEGHSTWRAHVAGHKAGFEEEWKQGKHPKTTEKRVIRIDRVTGEASAV